MSISGMGGSAVIEPMQPEPDAVSGGAIPKPLRESDFVDAIEAGQADACIAWLDLASGPEAVHALAALSDELRGSLLRLLSPQDAAEVIDQLPHSQAVDALEDLHVATAADIIGELPSDERADFIKALNDDHAEAILAELDVNMAAEARRLAAYKENSAGALMLTEFLAFRESATVRDVLADMEANAARYADFNIQYTYVIDKHRRLRGVIPIRRLLMAPRTSQLSALMIPDPVRAIDSMPFQEVQALFREHPFMGLPVTTADGTLLGVVEQSDVHIAATKEADELYRQSQGIVGGEELRSMPLVQRSRMRLAWLSANIVLNIIAASVIAFYQNTLQAVIALAVFLPIISDMSGCSGNQAVAVSMRELTLGVTRPRDIFRVLFAECFVGIINGIALGILIGAVAYFWKGNIYLSAVVGVALAANTLIAVCVGGAVPLVLKAFKSDPALASGPILTTITDLCGFLIVLSLASMLMAHLA